MIFWPDISNIASARESSHALVRLKIPHLTSLTQKIFYFVVAQFLWNYGSYLNSPAVMPVDHIGAHSEGAEGVEDDPKLKTKGVQVEWVEGGSGVR